MTDLVIIGSGPGGYVAAIRAAQLGLSVKVVEKDPHLGGTCLHRGCIPTKALLHTAEVLDEVRSARSVGVDAGEPRLDMQRTHAFKKKVVRKNAKGIEFLFKKNEIVGLHGPRPGRPDPGEVSPVERPDGDGHHPLGPLHVLIATGSVPRPTSRSSRRSTVNRIVNSDAHSRSRPGARASLAVLGAGAVGTEFASIYASFGSRRDPDRDGAPGASHRGRGGVGKELARRSLQASASISVQDRHQAGFEP